MKLQLDPQLAMGYRSASQVARRVTERWAEENLYCVACSSSRLTAAAANTAVLDFRCPRCEVAYQLKAKNGRFGGVVTNSAYAVKIAAIDAGRVPNYVFLGYSKLDWLVHDLFVVPGHFISRAAVVARKPLKPSAKRAGWIGSNILLHALPPEGRLALVSGGVSLSPTRVRRRWSQFNFLREDARAGGGWAADVLACVREVERTRGPEFLLGEFYKAYEGRLAALHPGNHHVQPKIRQQLQVLRDGGVLTFIGNGRYRIIG